MNGTLFYVLGGCLAGLAVITSFLGIKFERFPRSNAVMWGTIVVFAALVVGATTLAVRHSADEQEARAAELKSAEVEESQGNVTSSTGAPQQEGGGGEAAAEEEASGGKEASKEAAGSANAPAAGAANKGAEGARKAGAKKGAASTKKAKAAPPASSTLKLAASPTQIAFNTKQLSASAGKVTIDFTNPAPLEHDVAIEQNGKVIAVSKRITEGETSVSATLKPGSYTFLCTVPGHAEAGMEGTLTVK